MEQQGWDLNNFEKLVKNAINVKTKTALRPRSYVCKTNQYWLCGNLPSAAKASTQGQPMKDPKVEEPKKLQELKT